MESPFKAILHTNAVPSDSQCVDIHAFLKHPREELAKLSQEVARLQLLLVETTAKRDQLKDFVDAHLALVSPVRRLPDDIMRALFLETLPTSRNTAISPDEGPLLLSQISRTWRELTHTTPRLWASMHIIVPELPRLPRLMATVQIWLERSGAVPLDLTVIPSRAWRTDCDTSPFLPTLLSVSRRWKSVEIDLPPSVQPYVLSSLAVEDVPLLQSIKLGTHAPEYGEYPGARPPFSTFPFLRTRGLRSFDFDGYDDEIPSSIQWGALRHLSLRVTNGPHAGFQQQEFHPFPFPMLHQCHMLETLNLIIDFASMQAPAQHPISLPHLSRLVISAYSTGELLQYFFLPALHTLSIHSHAPIKDPSSLSQFSSILKCLKIFTSAMQSPLLREVLAALPALEDLRLDGEPLRPDALQMRGHIPGMVLCFPISPQP